jgi:hypothetical protein
MEIRFGDQFVGSLLFISIVAGRRRYSSGMEWKNRMHLNPKLSQLLEAYEPERLQAILLWFNAEQQQLENPSQRLAALLEETSTLDVEACYQAADRLKLQDAVEITILNEFGPEFRQKPSFPWLSKTLCNRFSI